MLLLMMELRGRFNTKMIKKAQFGDVYFDEMGAFISIDKDRVTGAVCPSLFSSEMSKRLDLIRKTTYRTSYGMYTPPSHRET